MILFLDTEQLSSSEAASDYCLFDHQCISFELGFIKHGDGPPGLPLSGHLHKGKTLSLTGMPISGDLGGGDLSCFRKQVPDLMFTGLKR